MSKLQYWGVVIYLPDGATGQSSESVSLSGTHLSTSNRFLQLSSSLHSSIALQCPSKTMINNWQWYWKVKPHGCVWYAGSQETKYTPESGRAQVPRTGAVCSGGSAQSVVRHIFSKHALFDPHRVLLANILFVRQFARIDFSPLRSASVLVGLELLSVPHSDVI